MKNDIQTELEAAYEVGLATVEHEVNGRTVLVVREGYEPRIVDTSAFEERTPWPKGHAQLLDEGSFVAYLKRFWRADESVLFAGADSRLSATFDYHRSEDERLAGNPKQGGRGDFGATFAPRFTPSWIEWRAANEKPIDQEKLLEFLERRMGDIASPDGAELREVISFFKVHSNIGFVSGRNLTNGTANFQWSEEAAASAGAAGDLSVPTEFTVLLKPFRDLSDARAFTAQLRWRIQRPNVSFSFHLQGESLDDYVEVLNELRRLRISAELGTEPVVFFGSAS